MADKVPLEIKLHQQSGLLSLNFDDKEFKLDAEYLRVYSPSAEVMGHAPGQEVLQIGKEDVLIQNIVPVGNYAIQIVFDDEHNSGIYSWEYLKYLSANEDILWAKYVKTLSNVGLSRDPNEHVLRFET